MIPIITIDGPVSSGKGTVARLVAARLAWHLLDSGALYRVLGLYATRQGVALDDQPALIRLAENLPVVFREQNGDTAVVLDGEDVSADIRREEVGEMASQVAVLQPVRDALFASAEERARRRYAQLKEKGFDATLATLIEDIQTRDDRDMNRDVAPLKPADDAVEIDSTSLSVEQVVDAILDEAARRSLV